MKAKSSLSITLAVLLAVAWLAGCSQLLPRSDSQVAAEVQNKINADANVPNKQITVRAEKGTVTLTGFVGSEGERTLAASDAGAVAGVKTVINNLQVSAAAAAVAPAPVAAAPPMVAPPAVSEPAPVAAPAPQSARRTDSTAVSPRRAPVASAQPNREYRAAAPASAAIEPPPAAVAPADAVANAAPATPAVPVEPAPVTVPDGTVLNVRLIDGIDTSRSQAGEVFRGTLDTPVVVGDKVAVPADADVTGRIVQAKQAGHYAGQSALALELTQISYNGKTTRSAPSSSSSRVLRAGSAPPARWVAARSWAPSSAASSAAARVRPSGRPRARAPAPASRPSPSPK